MYKIPKLGLLIQTSQIKVVIVIPKQKLKTKAFYLYSSFFGGKVHCIMYEYILWAIESMNIASKYAHINDNV